MTLRRSSQLLIIVIASLGVVLASALIVMTARLNVIVQRVQTSVQNVAISEDITFELGSLRDAKDETRRNYHEERLRGLVAQAGQYVDSRREAAVLARLTMGIERFIASTHARAPPTDTAPTFEAALGAARELRHINIEQSQTHVNLAARWDRLANVIGAAAITAFAIGLGCVAWWLQRRAFKPMIGMAEAIERYAKGEWFTRAAENGPSEFRSIAHRFNDMASTLERQRTAQLTFLAGVAHDLRNPLSALKLAVGMVVPDQPLPSEGRVRQLFSRVNRQIDRMDRMVDDLLDASRIEAGNLELQMERCDARDFVRAVIDLFEPAKTTHQLVAEVPDQPVFVNCDPVRIEQVLTNLVSNAIKYSPRGGTVRITAARAAETVVMSVIDQGIGIPADEVEHVFEPFRRTGSSREAVPGVGLGLFVARRIVQAHGGRIALTSTVGRGSTFTVLLPVVTKGDAAVSGQVETRPSTAGVSNG